MCDIKYNCFLIFANRKQSIHFKEYFLQKKTIKEKGPESRGFRGGKINNDWRKRFRVPRVPRLWRNIGTKGYEMLKIRLEKKVPSPEGPEDFYARNPRDSELKQVSVKKSPLFKTTTHAQLCPNTLKIRR